MSGPKSSRYTLTPEQRRILAEQRALEKRKNVARESVIRNQKRIVEIFSSFSNAKQAADILLNRNGTDNGFFDAFSELQEIMAPVTAIAAKMGTEDVDVLESGAETVKNFLEKAEKIKPKLSLVAAENEMKLQESLKTDIDKGFSTSFADAQAAGNGIAEKISDLRLMLLQLRHDEYLSSELQHRVASALSQLEIIESDAFLKNYSALTVAPLVKECREFLENATSFRNEFERIYAEYLALCKMYDYLPKEYPCNESSIVTLKAEILQMNDEAAKDHEHAYISECVDAVMEEMGYSVIGCRDVIKRNGKHFRNELYRYGEGTAVNITYSADGKIAMELGGLDTVDRLPDGEETAALCASMEQFCGDFKEIERRILARGIVPAERISMLPVSAEYAQIINTTDYNMSDNVASLQIKKRRNNSKIRKNLRKG